PSLLDPGSLIVEPAPKLICRRQIELVSRDEQIALAGGGEADDLGIAFGAEEDPDRWVLARVRGVLGQIAHVEPKLSSMLGLERPQLEIDSHEAAQAAMKEEQVQVVVAVASRDPELPCDEAEVAAKLEEELLQVIDERMF